MFQYISGKLALKSDNIAVIDANGIGYKLYCSATSLNELGDIGSNAKLYTYLNFKANSDILDLYGFSSMEELNLFEMIIGVSRVGAKTAISLLSNISPSKFALCVVTNDSKYIAQKTPGLGAKGAERIVLELKDKFKGMNFDGMTAEEIMPTEPSETDNEAVSALVVLGYTPQEAKQAVAGVTGTVEEIIKIGLRNLMKG